MENCGLLVCVVILVIPEGTVYKEVEIQEVLHGNVHLCIQFENNRTHYVAAFPSIAEGERALRRCHAWCTARDVQPDKLAREPVNWDNARFLH